MSDEEWDVEWLEVPEFERGFYDGDLSAVCDLENPEPCEACG